MAFYTDFAGHYEAIFPMRDEALSYLEKWLPAQGRLLDIGCGPGRYCQALAGPGRACEGADPDPGMIEEARRLDDGGTYRLMGMEGIGLLSSGDYSGIYCIGNVLPHLPVPDLPGFLAHVRDLLRPEGVWIFQTVNFDNLLDLTDYEFPVIRHDGLGLSFRRSYRGITPEHLSFRTRLADRSGVIFDGRTDLHPRTSIQYRALHEAAGFTLIDHVADWKGQPFAAASASGSIFVWRRGA